MRSISSAAIFLSLSFVGSNTSPTLAQTGQQSTPRNTVARTRTLETTLNQIAGQMNVRVVVDEAIAEAPVAMPRESMAVDELLRHILAPYDAFYLMSAKDDGASSISAIWVYPRGTAREIELVAASSLSETRDAEGRLDSPDEALRLRGYETLLERQADRGMPTLQRALADPSDVVRAGALAAAVEAGVEISAADLATLFGDPSPAVRLQVLDAVEALPEAEAVAFSGIGDPDPAVRGRATALLNRVQGTPEEDKSDVQQQMLRKNAEREKQRPAQR